MLNNWQIFKELRQKLKYLFHTETLKKIKVTSQSLKVTKVNLKLNINHQVDKRDGL